jgi:hypothetical protein
MENTDKTKRNKMKQNEIKQTTTNKRKQKGFMTYVIISMASRIQDPVI